MINCFAQASLLWAPVKCKWFLIPPHRHHSFFPPPLPLIHSGERCNICHCFIMKCNVASYLWACYLLRNLLVVLALRLRVRISHVFPTAGRTFCCLTPSLPVSGCAPSEVFSGRFSPLSPPRDWTRKFIPPFFSVGGRWCLERTQQKKILLR